MRRFKELTDQEQFMIALDYKNGIPLRDISEKYKCLRSAVNTSLKHKGIKRDRNKVVIQSHTLKKIVRMYKQGDKVSRIIEKLNLNVSRKTIYNRLKNNHPDILGRKVSKLNDKEKDIVALEYKNGDNIKLICKRSGIGKSLFYRILKEKNIKLRHPKMKRN